MAQILEDFFFARAKIYLLKNLNGLSAVVKGTIKLKRPCDTHSYTCPSQWHG